MYKGELVLLPPCRPSACSACQCLSYGDGGLTPQGPRWCMIQGCYFTATSAFLNGVVGMRQHAIAKIARFAEQQEKHQTSHPLENH